LIPMAAVKDIQDRYFIYQLTDSNTVAMKQIEIAGSTGQNYLLKAGLQAGDKIIVNRIDLLHEGMTVVPVKKETE